MSNCKKCGEFLLCDNLDGYCRRCFMDEPTPAQPSENGIAYNYILHILKQQRNLLSRFSLNSEEEILEELEIIRIAEKWISDK